MPTYYKPDTRKGNRTYVVRGRIDGREHEIATPARDKGSAEDCWDEFKRRIRERRRDQPRKGEETFADAVAAYKAYRRPGKAEEGKLTRLIEHFGEMLVRDIDHAAIVRAANALKPKVSNATRNREVYTPAAAVLHYAAEIKMRDYLVVRKLKEDEPAKRRPAGNVESLLLAKTRGKQRLLVLVLFEQGWRIGETLRVRWEENIRLSDRTFQFYIAKNRRWKLIAMSDEVYDALKAEKEREGRLFPWRDRWTVYKWLTPLCDRLAIRFTPHMARHEFASGLNEQRASQADIAEAGSWTSDKSIARYTSVDTERARTLINSRKRGGMWGKTASG